MESPDRIRAAPPRFAVDDDFRRWVELIEALGEFAKRDRLRPGYAADRDFVRLADVEDHGRIPRVDARLQLRGSQIGVTLPSDRSLTLI